ncbi:MAG: Cytochrome c-type biogenesis protein CcmE [Candidatus Argoarchaeum ethanivorans]|uniref:Cytochrome c-type biogenesis protein CcmE n=1 Tax=Candidatus Argoarchaeum ethanivorans TaxID=2608793 RepID=A0A811TB78_9EURY|nr:MAG: Cytochrome c-type biogenesis protein CcmE [Candidatus Argoarchaeum ethanivorans]
MDKKQRIILSAVVVVALLVYAGFTSFSSEQLAYYQTVTEVVSGGDIERPVNINGIIVEDSTIRVQETQTLKFKITDNESTVDVVYKGILPNNYKEGISIVVTGTYHDNVVHASKLTLKCPSKYESIIDAET